VKEKNFLFVPQAGYNATANLFGGGRMALKTPVGKFEAVASASSEVLSTETSFSERTHGRRLDEDR